MSLLSATELGAIQSLAQSGMIGSATVMSRITIVTADGQESVWATSALDIPCWVRQITGDSSTLGAISGAVGIAQLFNIRVPIGTVVVGGDQIITDGETYTVESTNLSDTYPAWLECASRAIQ